MFFLSLLSQCKFANSTLLSLLSFSYFITPYDAQASSAFSALILNNVVEVPLKYAREVLGGKWGSDWALGYALTVHSSQGHTIHDPKKVWIVDDLQQWSNLAYLAVSRVEYLSQLERVVCPPEDGSEGAGTLTEQQLRKVIQRKLVAYKRQDAA